jgi:transcription termination factor Rho
MNDSPDFVDHFIRRIKQTKTNEEFFEELQKDKQGKVTTGKK